MQERKRRRGAPPAGVRRRLQHPVQTQEHGHVFCKAEQQSASVRPRQGPSQHVSVDKRSPPQAAGLAAHLNIFLHLECLSHADWPALWRKLFEPTLSPAWRCWSPSSLSPATGSVRDPISPWSSDSSHSRKQKVSKSSSLYSVDFFFYDVVFSQHSSAIHKFLNVAGFSLKYSTKPSLLPSLLLQAWALSSSSSTLTSWMKSQPGSTDPAVFTPWCLMINSSCPFSW